MSRHLSDRRYQRWRPSLGNGRHHIAKAFGTRNIFLSNVQAHGIKNGSIASGNLVEGGQMFFLTYAPK